MSIKGWQMSLFALWFSWNRYESLRIAFIDVVETGAKDKKATYYSKLVKVDKNDPTGKDQVIRPFLLSDGIS